jgi:hypothetical protein
MKYDVFMRTRTTDHDYSWVNKPDYMPKSVYDTCKSIIALCESESFAGLTADDWYSNFFYLRTSGCCLLARVAKTNYTSSDNQSIISFEGVAVKSESERRLFYNIPNLINELMPPAKSFRTRLDEDGSMPDVFSFEPLIDPFDGGTNLPAEINFDLNNNTAYSNLLKFTAFTEKSAGFIFGKNAKAFSALIDLKDMGFDYIFDFEQPDSVSVNENAFFESYKPVSFEYKKPVPTGIDKVAVKLLVQEAGQNSYKYKWEMKPWDSSVKDVNRARYATQFYEIGDQVELAKLELQKEGIKKFLVDNGWTKQTYGLRFERDTFKREENK